MGMSVLRLIWEHGLLLTPEVFHIPENPLAAKREGEPPQTDFIQTRACFTLVERDELWVPKGERQKTHVELFGDFAIGIRSSVARRLGAVPVHYMYGAFDGITGNPEDLNLSRELLLTLRELRSLAIAVARLEAKAANPKRRILDGNTLDRLGYVLRGDPAIRRRIDSLVPAAALEVMHYLDTDRGPAWSLVELIDIMLCLFQTADFGAEDARGLREPNAYFRQREWRIVQLLNADVRCQRLGSNFELDGTDAMPPDQRSELRARLRAISSEFFDDRRLEGSAILRGTRTRHFREFVDEVICPSSVAVDVGRLLHGDAFESKPMDDRSKWVAFVRRT